MKNHLHAFVWDERFDYFVNGNWVLINKLDGFVPKERLGLGNRFGDGIVRFSNLRIRKLQIGPPPPLNKREETLAFIEEYLKLYPDNAFLLSRRAVARANLKQSEKANEDMQKAVQSDPFFAQWGFVLGESYKNSGEPESAVNFYKLFLAAKPDSENCLENLAWILATSPDEKFRDGKAAVEYAEKVCKQTDYKNYGHLDTLAAAYAEAGNFDAAIKWEEKTIELAPDETKPAYRARLEILRAKKPYRDKPANHFENEPDN
jgi:tetratricopeptide (TPR) repeat protein